MVPPDLIHVGQSNECQSYMGMLRPQLLLQNTQCAQVERLRFHILCLCPVEVRQIVKRSGHIRMSRSQFLFPDIQCMLIELLRCLVARTTPEVECGLMEQAPCFYTHELIL